MRVGLICPYSLSVPGGVQNQVMGLARALARRGHTARVLAPCDGPPPATFVTPVGSSVLNPSNGSMAPIAPDPSAQFRTVRALWDESFDVIHLHEPFVPGPTLTAALVKPAPLVATFHAAGHQPAYTALAPVGRWIATRFDERVAVSEDALALVEPHIGGDWTVLFNGVDASGVEVGDREHTAGEAVNPDQSATPDQAATPEQTVFFLGRHEPRKGLEILLRAEPDLRTGTRILVAGEGESTEELKRRYPSSRIEWLGRVSDDERDRLMARATVFCAPSLGGESFGIILLEAMAAGTAVVASAIPGYEKVATGPSPHGEVPERPCVELATPDDPTSLAAALNAVLSNPIRREELVVAGLERARQFDLDTLCVRYLELYERAIASGDS